MRPRGCVVNLYARPADRKTSGGLRRAVCRTNVQGPGRVNSVIVWFRQDLRLEDNPALAEACVHAARTDAALIPVFIFEEADETGPAVSRLGEAARWWRHHALEALAQALAARGARLILRRGDARTELFRLVQETGAQAVYWNRRYDPAGRARDAELKRLLRDAEIGVGSFNASLLFEPHEVANAQGKPFQVFTPFWKRCLADPRLRERTTPVRFEGPWRSPVVWPASGALTTLSPRPRIPWDAEFATWWRPGAAGATERLHGFLSRALSRYDHARDLPGEDATSRLSPWLRWGEIGPRQVWAAVEAHCRVAGVSMDAGGPRRFLTELGWREFAHHLLYHFPHTVREPLRPEFARFPWAADREGQHWRAWRRGLTGYPIVDAGMRQLWRTGWMHNRVRMIASSFLVKHLRVPWQRGAAWFMETLVDADVANNTLGWQWVSGCGADAAPYFRIFAPVTQGQRFDPRGDYVRTYVPELARLPDRWIHNPWQAPASVLAEAGVVLGKTYPHPLVDHATARAAALEAFTCLKRMREDGGV